MRLDKQIFVCDYCKKRVIRNKDDIDLNTETLNVFEVESHYTQIETEEFCSEECMINRLPELMLKCRIIGCRPDFTISNYDYEYEEEEVNEENIL